MTVLGKDFIFPKEGGRKCGKHLQPFMRGLFRDSPEENTFSPDRP
nr:MAG TPA: hypothetical protein [Caudoviricetes sp.]